ncbi:MAG: GIY-YIG nuclease family protein [Candidatus Odinarchaeota archaeon]
MSELLFTKPFEEDAINQITHSPGVYCIINASNNKCYVGQTGSLCQRLHTHLKNLQKGKHPNKDLQNDFNSYPNQFRVLILEKIPLGKMMEALLEQEKYWINSIIPEKLYNKQRKQYKSEPKTKQEVKIPVIANRGRKLVGSSIFSGINRITVPKRVRNRLGLKPGSVIRFYEEENGSITVDY